MSLIAKILAVFQPRPAVPWNGCTHTKPTAPFIAYYHGEKIVIPPNRLCRECVPLYYQKVSTTCAHCFKPILPGWPIALAPSGKKYPYTHMGLDCEEGAQCCGHWGEGKLLPLHQIDTYRYPASTVQGSSANRRTG